jgi:hypothetical protein
LRALGRTSPSRRLRRKPQAASRKPQAASRKVLYRKNRFCQGGNLEFNAFFKIFFFFTNISFRFFFLLPSLFFSIFSLFAISQKSGFSLFFGKNGFYIFALIPIRIPNKAGLERSFYEKTLVFRMRRGFVRGGNRGGFCRMRFRRKAGGNPKFRRVLAGGFRDLKRLR